MTTLRRILLLCGSILLLMSTSRLTVIQFINPIVLVLLWDLLHPTQWPLATFTTWMIFSSLLVTVAPPGSLVIIGAILIRLFQIIQRNYLEHRRMSSFIFLLLFTSIFWDGAITLTSVVWSIARGIPSPWIGFQASIGRMILSGIGMTTAMMALVWIETQWRHEIISETLRRYYENIHRPHFRSSSQPFP